MIEAPPGMPKPRGRFPQLFRRGDWSMPRVDDVEEFFKKRRTSMAPSETSTVAPGSTASEAVLSVPCSPVSVPSTPLPSVPPAVRPSVTPRPSSVPSTPRPSVPSSPRPSVPPAMPGSPAPPSVPLAQPTPESLRGWGQAYLHHSGEAATGGGFHYDDDKDIPPLSESQKRTEKDMQIAAGIRPGQPVEDDDGDEVDTGTREQLAVLRAAIKDGFVAPKSGRT